MPRRSRQLKTKYNKLGNYAIYMMVTCDHWWYSSAWSVFQIIILIFPCSPCLSTSPVQLIAMDMIVRVLRRSCCRGWGLIARSWSWYRGLTWIIACISSWSRRYGWNIRGHCGGWLITGTERDAGLTFWYCAGCFPSFFCIICCISSTYRPSSWYSNTRSMSYLLLGFDFS